MLENQLSKFKKLRRLASLAVGLAVGLTLIALLTSFGISQYSDWKTAEEKRLAEVARQEAQTAADEAQAAADKAAIEKMKDWLSIKREPLPSLQDCDWCPEMVVLKPGDFVFGKGNDKRTVRIYDPFAIGKYEITFDQFEVFSLETSTPMPSDNGLGWGSRPVSVSWDTAGAYADWLSSHTGKKYRLPSEEEWEFAARGGESTRFYFGDEEDWLCAFANHRDPNRVASRYWNLSSSEVCAQSIGERVLEVGLFEPNQFGLYDVLGNVSEWTTGVCTLPPEQGSQEFRSGFFDSDHDYKRSSSSSDSRRADRIVRGGDFLSISGSFLDVEVIDSAYWDCRAREKSSGFRLVREI